VTAKQNAVKLYVVRLSAEERERLSTLISVGKYPGGQHGLPGQGAGRHPSAVGLPHQGSGHSRGRGVSGPHLLPLVITGVSPQDKPPKRDLCRLQPTARCCTDPSGWQRERDDMGERPFP
jgi:hypothetical protein